MKKLIIITGPTAVGKTQISLDLAERLNTEIVSCDSRQIYKELNIGTAKPSTAELLRVNHHFINHISITEEYSAGIYQREALAVLKKIFETKENVILTGGTGLYIKALLEGLDEFPQVTKEINAHYEKLLLNEGIEKLQIELKEKDLDYYSIVDIHNSRRLIRALGVIKVSGMPYSSFMKHHKEKRFFEPVYIVLERDRKELYKRINKRVDKMMEDGLLEEVKSLTYYVGLKALQTVGYQELFSYFSGDYTLEYAIEKIKQHSRNYAKRQLTWFRKVDSAIYLPAENITIHELMKIL